MYNRGVNLRINNLIYVFSPDSPERRDEDIHVHFLLLIIIL